MHIKSTILSIFMVLSMFFTNNLNGQAFDGVRTLKVMTGFSVQAPVFGPYINFEEGINDYISAGIEVGYMAWGNMEHFATSAYWRSQNSDELEYISYDFDEFDEFDELLLVNLRADLHFNMIFNLPEPIDIYMGGKIGRNIDSQLGGRYMFTESLGLNFELVIPLKKIIGQFYEINYLTIYEKPYINLTFVF